MSYHSGRGLGYTVDAWGFASNEPDLCPFTHVMRNGRCLTLDEINLDAVEAERIVSAYAPVLQSVPSKVATGDRVAGVYGAPGVAARGQGTQIFQASTPSASSAPAAASFVPSSFTPASSFTPGSYGSSLVSGGGGSSSLFSNAAGVGSDSLGIPKWAMYGGAALLALVLLGGGGRGR